MYKVKDFEPNGVPKESITKSFLSIVDKDMQNPFGGGHEGYAGGNIKKLNIPAPYPPLHDLTKDGP